MKTKLKIFLMILGIISTCFSSELEEKVELLTSQIEELQEEASIGERKYFIDKINFSPELRFRVDNITYKLSPFKAEQQVLNKNRQLAERRGAFGYTKNFDPAYYLRLRINMYTQFTEDLKFIGRMLAIKTSQDNQRICILSKDISASGRYTSTIIEFDRAYFDWRFHKNKNLELTLSVGILPTSGGISSNLIENTKRKSFFPSLIFDATSYGAILTASINKSFWIRAIYGKGYTLNKDIFYFQCNRENILNNDIKGIFLEDNHFEDTILYLGFVKNGKIKAVPYLGSFFLPFVAMQTNTNSNINPKYMKDLGDIYNIGAGIQKESIFNKLDLFLHIGVSIPDGNGNCMNYTSNKYPECKIGGEPLSNNTSNVYTNARYAGGTLLKKTGYAVYTGFRYTLKRLKKAKFGFEYNFGSKWWWSATQGAEDVFNKLANRGNTYEAYYIQPFNRFIYLRLGYLLINEKYTGSGWHFGTPAEKDGKIQNIYFLINAYF